MWYVYIIRCADNTLYTGVTTDIARRIESHNSGKGARYTRARTPVVLVHYEKHHTRSSALKREACIKRMPKERKVAIISKLIVRESP